MNRWQRYWFAEGGRVSCAFLRAGIAMAVLMSLAQLATLSTVVLPGPPDLYRPVGPWMLIGRTIPPDWLITTLWVMGFAGGGAMLIGLCSRAATAISFVGFLGIASLSYASSANWSHQYNVVLLAQLAFLGARGGDTLSLDALIRHRRGLPPVDIPGAYQWSVRLVQLAIALMFAGACFHKLLHGHFTLRWALSDSLRHHLLVRYDLAGIDRPALVDWLLEDVWRYRTAALLNLGAQLLPICACIFVRRPLIRAACGAVFVCEVLGLGFVVSLWNDHWLPLVIAFVDWDRLNGDRPPDKHSIPTYRVPKPRQIFVIAFFVYELITAFVPTLDQRLNTYPFSGFPMFANIRAYEPYDRHFPYGVLGDRFIVTSDQPLDDIQQRWFDHQNRGVYTITDPAKLEPKLRAMLAEGQRRYPERGIRALRHQIAVFMAPAYPAPARFDITTLAITGEITTAGEFRSQLGKSFPKVMVVDNARIIDTTSAANANTYVDGMSQYVYVELEEERWLVSMKK